MIQKIVMAFLLFSGPALETNIFKKLEKNEELACFIYREAAK